MMVCAQARMHCNYYRAVKWATGGGSMTTRWCFVPAPGTCSGCAYSLAPGPRPQEAAGASPKSPPAGGPPIPCRHWVARTKGGCPLLGSVLVLRSSVHGWPLLAPLGSESNVLGATRWHSCVCHWVAPTPQCRSGCACPAARFAELLRGALALSTWWPLCASHRRRSTGDGELGS